MLSSVLSAQANEFREDQWKFQLQAWAFRHLVSTCTRVVARLQGQMSFVKISGNSNCAKEGLQYEK
jgi:hypothetical protein